MDELLRSNEKAAIIGDDEGKFHIESKPEEMTHRDWNRWLRSHYREPGYWHDNEEGVPLHYLVGSDFSDGGNLVARFEARIEPYKVFSHESSGLCVRAVFLPHSHSEFFRWVVGVKEDTVNLSVSRSSFGQPPYLGKIETPGSVAVHLAFCNLIIELNQSYRGVMRKHNA